MSDNDLHYRLAQARCEINKKYEQWREATAKVNLLNLNLRQCAAEKDALIEQTVRQGHTIVKQREQIKALVDRMARTERSA